MPVTPTMNLPTPKNWQEFESMVCAAQSLKWASSTLTKNGRPGQKQEGVDIYGPDDLGRPTGLQCKCYKDPLDIKLVVSEVENAENFSGPITTLFIATTTDHDAPLQKEVRKLSQERTSLGKFAVGLLFWDDIINGLMLNPNILKGFYPQIQIPVSTQVNKARGIAALELGYYGPYLWEYILLIMGEFGLIANEDPDNLKIILSIIESQNDLLMPPKEREVINESLQEVINNAFPTDGRDPDWDIVEVYSKRIASRIKSATSFLEISEANILEIGRNLGNIDHNLNNLPSDLLVADLERKILTIIPKEAKKRLKDKIKKLNGETSGYAWARGMYTFVDSEIRWSSN